MKYIDRLKELVGHDVTVEITSGTTWRSVEGVLDEVGADFVTIRVWDGGHGFPESDNMWYIPLKNVLAVIHPTTCTWCHEQVHIKIGDG